MNYTPQHAADPTRPYKMYAAIVSAFLTSLIATNASDLPAWAVGLIVAAVAAIAVYLTPNPLVSKPAPDDSDDGDGPYRPAI